MTQQAIDPSRSSSSPSLMRLVLILGTLTAFGPLAIDMYLPGLPSIAREFGTNTAAAQNTLSVFFVALAAGQAIYGPIADRVGRKLPLLIGFSIFTLASVACVLAPTLEALILARLFQALGGCAGMVVSRSVVRDLFDSRESARVYSFLMLVLGVAPITAPLIGGQLLMVSGWRAIFGLLACFGILCLALVAFGLPESLPVELRIREGLGSVFAVYKELLFNRHFIGYALTGGLISAAMFSYIAGSPFVIIELYGVQPQYYGFIFGSNALGLIGASQINRWLLGRYTSDSILKFALISAAMAGISLLIIGLIGQGGLVALLIPLFVCVASGGFVGPNTTALAMAPHGRVAGSASALLGALQFTVGTLASTSVSMLHNGTVIPMAGTIAACTILALVCLYCVAQSAQTEL